MKKNSIKGGSKKFMSNLKSKKDRTKRNEEIDNFRKSFKKLVESKGNIKYLIIGLIPSLYSIDDMGQEIIPKMNNELSKLFANKLVKNKKIYLSVFGFKFNHIYFNKDNNILILKLKPQTNDFEWLMQNVSEWKYKDEYNIDDIIYLYECFIKDMIESGSDTWRSQNDTIIIRKNVYDKNAYWINLKYKGIMYQK